jgi:hypothetical protein
MMGQYSWISEFRKNFNESLSDRTRESAPNKLIQTSKKQTNKQEETTCDFINNA